MEQPYPHISKDDLWRLQSDMKNFSAVQSDHAERLNRLERRHEDDGRSSKSIWGGSSPFPGLGASTPSADTSYNPAAEAFRNFDQDQNSTMIGSIHLDAEEEPKRGTSRANSVRFDESALGHFGHASRSSTEFFPMRSNSAFGSTPSLIERTASHRSDGRQSSTHSARLNSLGSETRASAAASAAAAPTGPPPGLFILGPLPSIIRCWLNNDYSNETMLYAAVCTGSYRSTLSYRLVEGIGRSGEIRDEQGERRLKIPVYLPEATISESSSRSASPAPSLPAVTVDFVVSDMAGDGLSIEILLGSDLLRFKNADILFSQDKLSLLDDERNRVAVPLVRPENADVFKHLVTMSSLVAQGGNDRTGDQAPGAESAESTMPTPLSARHDNGGEGIFSPVATAGKRPSVIGEGRRSMSTRELDSIRTGTADTESSNGTAAEPPPRPDPTTLGSWRRDASTNKDVAATTSFSSVASNSTTRGIRGKSMKVLRPSRSSTSRSISGLQSPGGPESGSSTPRWPDTATSPSAGDSEALGGDGRPTGTIKTKANPIGGGSAFSWMNPGGTRTTAP